VRRAAVAILLLPGLALADGVSEEAERKFDEGIKQMDAGHFDVGCPMLADSYRLEPLPGALFTLAECEAKWGKIASALGHYEDYLGLWEKMTSAQKSKQGSREKIARAQVAALDRDVPEITFVLPASAPEGLVIKRDDVALQSSDLGKPIRLDPGEHVIVVETINGKSKQTNLKVAKGEKRKLVLAIPEEDAPGTTSAPPPEAPKPSTGGGHLPITIAAGAVGLVGIGVGAVTGGIALGDKSTVDAHCTGLVCDQTGKNAVDDGRTMGLISTIGFIAGGIGVAAAVVLFLTEPKKSPGAGANVRFVTGPSGATLVGRF
jgi:hypothetical protein